MELLINEEGVLNLDFEDEVVKGACLTHEGEIVNERAKEAAS
jgi:NAD(P) transhydrogenase subunit alpha